MGFFLTETSGPNTVNQHPGAVIFGAVVVHAAHFNLVPAAHHVSSYMTSSGRHLPGVSIVILATHVHPTRCLRGQHSHRSCNESSVICPHFVIARPATPLFPAAHHATVFAR